MSKINEDIELAKSWCAASKVIESPGYGEGWRHSCYRLALEVERLRKYELLKSLLPSEFNDIYSRCAKGEDFDDILDNLSQKQPFS